MGNSMPFWKGNGRPNRHIMETYGDLQPIAQNMKPTLWVLSENLSFGLLPDSNRFASYNTLFNFLLDSRHKLYPLFLTNFWKGVSLIILNEVSESVDGLQIWVNLAHPKIKIQYLQYLIAIQVIFWEWFFQRPKKFQTILFLSKVTWFLRILGHSLIKCMEKHISCLQSNCVIKNFNWFALPRCRYI